MRDEQLTDLAEALHTACQDYFAAGPFTGMALADAIAAAQVALARQMAQNATRLLAHGALAAREVRRMALDGRTPEEQQRWDALTQAMVEAIAHAAAATLQRAASQLAADPAPELPAMPRDLTATGWERRSP